MGSIVTSGGGNDAHERVIDRPLQRAAVEHDFRREGQNMRRRLGRLRDIGVSPLVQGFHEKDAALRRVPPIFRGRVEHRGTLRHYIFLVGPTSVSGPALRTGAPFKRTEPRVHIFDNRQSLPEPKLTLL